MSCLCEQSCGCGCLTIWAESFTPCFSVCGHDGREVEFVDLAAFLPRVRLVARGVPDDVALEFINAAAVRFARLTGILKRRVVIDAQAGVQDYFLKAGQFEQLYRVDNVKQCDGCVNWRFVPPEKLWLQHAPDVDLPKGLLLEYTALPVQSACKVDKLLFDFYQDGIVAGALAELLLMRQYEFSDAQMAAVYEQKFKYAWNQAAIDMHRDFDNRAGVFFASSGARL